LLEELRLLLVVHLLLPLIAIAFSSVKCYATVPDKTKLQIFRKKITASKRGLNVGIYKVVCLSPGANPMWIFC